MPRHRPEPSLRCTVVLAISASFLKICSINRLLFCCEDNPVFHSFIKCGRHHAATDTKLEEVISIYAKSALKAKSIGADAVEIHSAHSSFPCQFFSPLTNKRIDKWGGSIENRTRIHREIIKAIRVSVGNDFPVLIKVGVEDAFKDGLTFEEGKIAAQIIAESGYDASEVSMGLVTI